MFNRLKEKDLPQARKRENVLLPAFPSDVAGPRLIKLAEVVHVPVLALDLCVFDSDGYSRMVGAATPTRASWAWSERYRKIQEELGQIIESAGALGLDELDEAKAVAVVPVRRGVFNSLPARGSLWTRASACRTRVWRLGCVGWRD